MRGDNAKERERQNREKKGGRENGSSEKRVNWKFSLGKEESLESSL